LEEIDKVIADFPITINRLFRDFSKQASILVVLTYEAGGGDFGQDSKKFEQNCRCVWVILLSRIIGLQNIHVEDCILLA